MTSVARVERLHTAVLVESGLVQPKGVHGRKVGELILALAENGNRLRL
jgi:hypothetical protein